MAKITYSPNPLLPADGRVIKEYDYPISVKELIGDLNLQEKLLHFTINGISPALINVDQILEVSDKVEIKTLVAGGDRNQNAKTIQTLLSVGALVAAFVPGGQPFAIGLSIAATLVGSIINKEQAIEQKNTLGAPERYEVKSAPNFSLNASSNPVRAYEPLPLVLSGRGHRMFPDINSNPYSEYEYFETINYESGVWVDDTYTVSQSNFERSCSNINADIFASGGSAGGTGTVSDWPSFLTFFNNRPGDPSQVDAAIRARFQAKWGLDPDANARLHGHFYNGDPAFQISGGLPSNTWFRVEDVQGLLNQYVWFRNWNSTNQTAPDQIDMLTADPISGDDSTFWGIPHYENGFGTLPASEANCTEPGNTPIQIIRTLADPAVCVADTLGPGLTFYYYRMSHFLDYLNGTITSAELDATQSNQLVYDIETWMCIDQEYRNIDRFHERLHHIFNFGFGDLDVSEDRMANTNLLDPNRYLKVNYTQSFEPNQEWALVPIPAHPANYTAAPFGNVDTRDGGQLRNNNSNNDGSFEGPATIIGPTDNGDYNFIYRRGPKNVNYIQIDIEGRFFKQDNVVGIQPLIAEYQFEYRAVGAGSWLPFPGTTLPEEIYGWDTFPRRLEFESGILPSNEYEVRLRKVTKDIDETGIIDELFIKQIKFYQDFDGDFRAENRRGISIVASGQLNGRLDRYSAMVRNKCWVYNPNTDSYSWDYSSNPADLFAYFARGGFYNNNYYNTGGSFPGYPFSPTIGWQNSADHPENENRMFGAGLEDDKIDFDSLKTWWVFCDNNNLKYDAVVNSKQNCFQILQQIALVGRASPSWHTGRLGVIIENPLDEPVALFGMHNIKKGTFQIQYQNDNIPDEIIVTYTDRDDDWTKGEYKVTMPNIDYSHRQVRLNLEGVTDRQQAIREANLQASRQYYGRRKITFDIDMEGLVVSRGDVLLLQHDITQWDQSARVIEADLNGIQMGRFKLDCTPKDSTGWLNMRHPDGTIIYFEYVMNPDKTLQRVGGDIWLSSQGPFNTGHPLNTENANSLYPNSNPEDWLVQVGPAQTPGKKVRISSVTPKDNNTVQLVCIDEEPAVYAREFDDLPNDIPWENAPDYVKPCISAFNVCAENIGDGKVLVEWEGDGALYYLINASINGGASLPLLNNGSSSFFSNSTVLQFNSGDSVDLIIVPFVISAPVADRIDGSVSFVVE